MQWIQVTVIRIARWVARRIVSEGLRYGTLVTWDAFCCGSKTLALALCIGRGLGPLHAIASVVRVRLGS